MATIIKSKDNYEKFVQSSVYLAQNTIRFAYCLKTFISNHSLLNRSCRAFKGDAIFADDARIVATNLHCLQFDEYTKYMYRLLMCVNASTNNMISWILVFVTILKSRRAIYKHIFYKLNSHTTYLTSRSYSPHQIFIVTVHFQVHMKN